VVTVVIHRSTTVPLGEGLKSQSTVPSFDRSAVGSALHAPSVTNGDVPETNLRVTAPYNCRPGTHDRRRRRRIARLLLLVRPSAHPLVEAFRPLPVPVSVGGKPRSPLVSIVAVRQSPRAAVLFSSRRIGALSRVGERNDVPTPLTAHVHRSHSISDDVSFAQWTHYNGPDKPIRTCSLPCRFTTSVPYITRLTRRHQDHQDHVRVI